VLSPWSKGAWVTLVAVCATLGAGRPARSQSEAPGYGRLKGEMKVLSAVIDEAMAQTFSPPFGVLQKAKGTFLPDFGVVFTLEVNLYPVSFQKLLQVRPPTESELAHQLKAKKERIQTIRQMVPRLLADHARGLRDVDSDEYVAVVVQLFYVQTGTEELPTQVVVEVKKHTLDSYWDQKLTYDQFLSQAKIIEY
jgi:hypothetical protein